MLEPAERERRALAEIARLRSRLKSRVLVCFLLAGVALGCVGYALVRALQFRMTANGSAAVSFPYISGVGFLLPFLLLGSIGRWVAMTAVRARMPAWVAEVARSHGVERAVLTETTDLLAEIDVATS